MDRCAGFAGADGFVVTVLRPLSELQLGFHRHPGSRPQFLVDVGVDATNHLHRFAVVRGDAHDVEGCDDLIDALLAMRLVVARDRPPVGVIGTVRRKQRRPFTFDDESVDRVQVVMQTAVGRVEGGRATPQDGVAGEDFARCPSYSTMKLTESPV